MRHLCWLFLMAWTTLAQDGAAIYKTRCSTCHDAPQGRVPPVSALKAMNPLVIVQALENGVMKPQAEGLSSAERFAVALYLGSPAPKAATTAAAAFCKGNGQPLALRGPAWGGWSPDAANTRFQEAAAAGLTAGDVPKLQLKWAFGMGDQIVTRGAPAVAGGRLFVGSQSGTVYSLDARTGCIVWTFQADAEVRSAITVGTAGSGNAPAVFFGDQHANAYALDASAGKPLWKVHVESHFAAMITGASLFNRGMLYVPVSSSEEAYPALPGYECCTFRGSVAALDAGTGKQVWKTYTIAEEPKPLKKSKSGTQLHGPSGAGVWSTPTLDEKRDAIYVATGDSYSDPAAPTSDSVLALDRKTGKILWSRQLAANDAFNLSCSIPGKMSCPDADGPDHDFGQPPILISMASGKRALVIGQKSGVAHALDPDREGAILWQTRVGKGGSLGGIQWGSAVDRQNMYVALSDIQIMPVADPKSPQGYHLDLNPTAGGGLFALQLATGEKQWTAKPAPCGDRKNCSPAQSGAVTAIPGVVFSGSVDGHLRGYSAATGEIIWDIDTVRDYETVNGLKAHGGSLDGPGPVVAGGMLYVNSGYGQWGGIPGNVLLAFSVSGK